MAFWMITTLSLQTTLSMVRCDMLIERAVGLEPDKLSFTYEHCTQSSCSSAGAVPFTSNSCQCKCNASAPTYSLQARSCLQQLPDCNEATFAGTAGVIFSFRLSPDLDMQPKLSIVETPELKPMSLSTPFGQGCTFSLFKDTLTGWENLTSVKIGIHKQEATNETYLKWERADNVTSSQLNGLLIRIQYACTVENSHRSFCLALKFQGFSRVQLMTVSQKASSNHNTTDPNALYYILGGCLGGAILIFLAGFMIWFGFHIRRHKVAHPAVLRVNRLDIDEDITGDSRYPARKLKRIASSDDLTKDGLRSAVSEPAALAPGIVTQSAIQPSKIETQAIYYMRNHSPKKWVTRLGGVGGRLREFTTLNAPPAPKLYYSPQRSESSIASSIDERPIAF